MRQHKTKTTNRLLGMVVGIFALMINELRQANSGSEVAVILFVCGMFISLLTFLLWAFLKLARDVSDD